MTRLWPRINAVNKMACFWWSRVTRWLLRERHGNTSDCQSTWSSCEIDQGRQSRALKHGSIQNTIEAWPRINEAIGWTGLVLGYLALIYLAS